MNSILSPDDYIKILPVNKKYSECSVYLICGGGKTARSETIKLIADFCAEKNIPYYGFCTVSDCNSVCAVYLPAQNTIVADSNYFNKIKSFYPSISEKTVSLDIYSDSKNITKYEKELKNNFDKSVAFRGRFQKYKNAAANVKGTIKTTFLSHIDRGKIANYIIRFLSKNRLYPRKEPAELALRRLGAIMPTGIHTDNSEFSELDKVYVLTDPYGMVSELLISGICFALNECNTAHTVFLCGLTDSPEHIIIPELSVGFYTENECHQYNGKNRVPLCLGRFLSDNDFGSEKESVYFDVLGEFLDEAVFSMYEIYTLDNLNDKIIKNALPETAYKKCADYITNDINTLLSI